MLSILLSYSTLPDLGWSFGFTSIVKRVSLYGHRKDTHIVFPDGSSYKILGDSDYLTEDTTLSIDANGLQDYTLEKKIDANQYILTYSNGNKEYFDGTYGNIIKKEDKFGNCITFEYKDDEFFKGSFVSGSTTLISVCGNGLPAEYKMFECLTLFNVMTGAVSVNP